MGQVLHGSARTTEGSVERYNRGTSVAQLVRPTAANIRWRSAIDAPAASARCIQVGAISESRRGVFRPMPTSISARDSVAVKKGE